MPLWDSILARKGSDSYQSGAAGIGLKLRLWKQRPTAMNRVVDARQSSQWVSRIALNPQFTVHRNFGASRPRS